MAERDKTLVNILERLADEMSYQDKVLDELKNRQIELARTVESAGLHLRGTQVDSERTYDNLTATISHYRSDMLKLVSEQDNINRNIEDLQKALKAATLTVDVTSKKLVEIDDRLSKQEKAAKEHYEHEIKQPGILRDAISSSSRDFTKLHAGTEKRLTELEREMTRRLDGFQHETMRRLLLLDSIVTSLQTLLVRTEPPEKKPLWIAQLFVRLRGFFRRMAAKFPKRKK